MPSLRRSSRSVSLEKEKQQIERRDIENEVQAIASGHPDAVHLRECNVIITEKDKFVCEAYADELKALKRAAALRTPSSSSTTSTRRRQLSNNTFVSSIVTKHTQTTVRERGAIFFKLSELDRDRYDAPLYEVTTLGAARKLFRDGVGQSVSSDDQLHRYSYATLEHPNPETVKFELTQSWDYYLVKDTIKIYKTQSGTVVAGVLLPQLLTETEIDELTAAAKSVCDVQLNALEELRNKNLQQAEQHGVKTPAQVEAENPRGNDDKIVADGNISDPDEEVPPSPERVEHDMDVVLSLPNGDVKGDSDDDDGWTGQLDDQILVNIMKDKPAPGSASTSKSKLETRKRPTSSWAGPKSKRSKRSTSLSKSYVSTSTSRSTSRSSISRPSSSVAQPSTSKAVLVDDLDAIEAILAEDREIRVVVEQCSPPPSPTPTMDMQDDNEQHDATATATTTAETDENEKLKSRSSSASPKIVIDINGHSDDSKADEEQQGTATAAAASSIQQQTKSSEKPQAAEQPIDEDSIVDSIETYIDAIIRACTGKKRSTDETSLGTFVCVLLGADLRKFLKPSHPLFIYFTEYDNVNVDRDRHKTSSLRNLRCALCDYDYSNVMPVLFNRCVGALSDAKSVAEFDMCEECAIAVKSHFPEAHDTLSLTDQVALYCRRELIRHKHRIDVEEYVKSTHRQWLEHLFVPLNHAVQKYHDFYS